MNSWKAKLLAGSALTTALLTFAGTTAQAAAAPQHPPTVKVVKTLSSAFVGPLQFAVAGSKVFVADSFTSTLNLIGVSKPIATGPSAATGGDLAGVAVNARDRSIAYTTSNADHSTTALTILQRGHKPVVADLSGFEKKYNPDHRITYGTSSTDPCVINALASAPGGGIPVSYQGDIDSHPYAVAALPNGAWAVADAGGNDIVKVDRFGHVSLITVLPAQPVKVTAAFAAASGLPACVVGITYKFEAVPTDVEVGPHGVLYVSTLPGGPEGPDSGNPGSVYRLDRSGHPTRIATGFAGATNLAIDPHGTIYVAEISAGQISKVVCGKPQAVISLPGVVGVEHANGHLYASTAPAAAGGSGPGTVVVLGPTGRQS